MNTKPLARLWLRWAVWSLAALILSLTLVGFGRFSGIILGAWAVGVVVAATLILCAQPQAIRRALAKQSSRRTKANMAYSRR